MHRPIWLYCPGSHGRHWVCDSSGCVPDGQAETPRLMGVAAFCQECDTFRSFLTPKINRAMLHSAMQTTLMDLWPIVKTVLKVFAGMVLIGTGNILTIGLAGYYWFKIRKKSEDQ
mgnify:CR=1 FL=1